LVGYDEAISGAIEQHLPSPVDADGVPPTPMDDDAGVPAAEAEASDSGENTAGVEAEAEPQLVPLAALIDERTKRQEMEAELAILRRGGHSEPTRDPEPTPMEPEPEPEFATDVEEQLWRANKALEAKLDRVLGVVSNVEAERAQQDMLRSAMAEYENTLTQIEAGLGRTLTQAERNNIAEAAARFGTADKASPIPVIVARAYASVQAETPKRKADAAAAAAKAGLPGRPGSAGVAQGANVVGEHMSIDEAVAAAMRTVQKGG